MGERQKTQWWCLHTRQCWLGPTRDTGGGDGGCTWDDRGSQILDSWPNLQLMSKPLSFPHPPHSFLWHHGLLLLTECTSCQK